MESNNSFDRFPYDHAKPPPFSLSVPRVALVVTVLESESASVPLMPDHASSRANLRLVTNLQEQLKTVISMAKYNVLYKKNYQAKVAYCYEGLYVVIL